MCYSTIAVKTLCSNHSRALSTRLWREANQLSADELMSLQRQSGGPIFSVHSLPLNGDNIGPFHPSVAHLSLLKFTIRPVERATAEFAPQDLIRGRVEGEANGP